jgi:uncharacterized protein (TIGR02145 family)
MKIKVIFLLIFGVLISLISCKKESNLKCIDADGNNYKMVRIGNQIWMAENLKTTHYNNGDEIATTPLNYDYELEIEPKYQWPSEGDEINVPIYGRLYTWFVAIDERNVCPPGWHLPSQQEWEILVNYLGGYAIAGGKMKEKGTLHWTDPNTGANNSSGFKALPGGNRIQYGMFNVIGKSSSYWSSTEWDNVNIFFIYLSNESTESYLANNDRKFGFNIRCIKDN